MATTTSHDPVIRWEARTQLGRRRVRHLRSSGLVPGVIYGAEVESTSIQCPESDVTRALRRGAHLVTLEGPDGRHRVLVKDIQYDPFGQTILHVDFHKISLTEKMEIDVPLVVQGTPEGVTGQGGVLETPVKELKVRCLPTDIPDRIEIDVAKLKLNERMRLKEVTPPAGVEFLASEDLVLAAVHEPKEAPPAEPAEAAVATGPTEPEVIKKGKLVEGAEEAAPPKA